MERHTKFGRLLRRTSLDELPQLANVVLGHMSLVGPRPPLPSEVERYDETIGRRLLVRPGMTGLWQIRGRNGMTLDERLRLDIAAQDGRAAERPAKTIPAVVTGKGAY